MDAGFDGRSSGLPDPNDLARYRSYGEAAIMDDRTIMPAVRPQ